MQEKWQVRNKKAYLNPYCVNIKTKEILALEVTDEKVHDVKVMPKLIEHILKKTITILKSSQH